MSQKRDQLRNSGLAGRHSHCGLLGASPDPPRRGHARVPCQVLGRFSGSGKVGEQGSARCRCAPRGPVPGQGLVRADGVELGVALLAVSDEVVHVVDLLAVVPLVLQRLERPLRDPVLARGGDPRADVVQMRGGLRESGASRSSPSPSSWPGRTAPRWLTTSPRPARNVPRARGPIRSLPPASGADVRVGPAVRRTAPSQAAHAWAPRSRWSRLGGGKYRDRIPDPITDAAGLRGRRADLTARRLAHTAGDSADAGT